MFRFLNMSASPTVGNTAQPMRPPVHEKLFDTPDTMIVRSSIPGSAAIDWCTLPSNRMFSYTSSE